MEKMGLTQQGIYNMVKEMQALFVIGVDVTAEKLLFCFKDKQDWTEECRVYLKAKKERMNIRQICLLFQRIRNSCDTFMTENVL